MHNMTIQIVYIVLNFIRYELGGAILTRSSEIMFTLWGGGGGGGKVKKELTLRFWKCRPSCVDSKSQ